ncbi:MAG: Crp/Fnr family transcriptional regulator [Lachnospiraceae bacterium]|nr:Crp/Fnr family transcriptional regulator [Lachnospiraceae bacterium]MBP3610329.1 Crp/Fnr family transcriptional regulator [Lachnospiraceae bacterium]
MKKYFPVLRKCSLFQQIQEEQLSALLQCLGAIVKSYSKKESILKEGLPAKHIGIVLSGSVQMIQIDYYGNRSIVSHAEPSELFGESFACAEVSSIPISVVANESCEIMLIECQRMIHSCSNACEFHQQLIYNLLKNVARKNIQFHQKIEITSKRSTREKLMTYLILQAKKANSNRFDIPFDRQELADYLEVDRSGLSAEISKLRKEGILRSEKKRFELL